MSHIAESLFLLARNVLSYSMAGLLMLMSNLSIFASHNVAYFACLHTQNIFWSRLMLGSLDLFNTLELTITYFHNHGANFSFAPQHFLPIYLEARRRAYSLANIESPFRMGSYPLIVPSLPYLESKLEENLNQFYLRHQTPYASHARKRILSLPLLIQRRRGKSTISPSTSLMLLDRTLQWRKCK